MSCAGHTAITCGECSVTWELTDGFVAQRKRDHKTFYCPNGHSRWFPGKTKEEKQIAELKADVKRLEHSYEYVRDKRDQYRDLYEHEVRRRTGYQGALAKQRRLA